MTISISDHFNNFADKSLPAQQAAEYVAYSQNEFYFHLAALKNRRREQVAAHFSQTKVKKIFISANISAFGFELPGLNIEFLDKGYFHEDSPQLLEQKMAYVEDSIVIVNNNDVGHNGNMQYYAKFFSQCDKTIFISWDWDNHHWLELSTFLAAHSDIYAPAHHENLYLLSRFNWLTAGPVYCGTVQWSRKYIADRLPDMLNANRSDAPLGKHIPYGPFSFRNQVIATLNKHYPTIGFSDHSFHTRTAEDRFTEWCSHKSHWIVPVLNDVPIRIFDALVTGGIAIVPESLRLLPPINKISRDHILFYTPHDIIDPKSIIEKANKQFDKSGADGIRERHEFALEKHHGDNRIRQMLDYVKEIFELSLPEN